MEYYANHLGTTFGFSFSATYGIYDAAHSYRTFGLHPKGKPVIGTPDPQEHKVVVPGRNGDLDMTTALTGDVHYGNRTGKWEFTQTGGRRVWDVTYHKLKNMLHGKTKHILMDEERDGYYTGRVYVEEPQYDDKKGVAYFTITADLEPYKRALNAATQKWLWDPFNFETGFIYQPAEIPMLLASPSHDAFISYNGYFPPETQIVNVNIPANTMPITPVIYILPVLEDSPALPSNTRVRMTYPSTDMVYPIDSDTFDHGKTTDGWNTCLLRPGANNTQFPDFAIKDKAGFVGFIVEPLSDESYPVNEVKIVMDYRAGWL